MDPATYESTGQTLKGLLTVAWLLPLAGFAIEIFGGYLWDRRSKVAACLAVACIFTGFCCSTAALVTWGRATGWAAFASAGHHGVSAGHDAGGAAHQSVLDDPRANTPVDAKHP